MPIDFAANHVEKRLSARERAEPEAIARLRSEAALLERLSGLGATPRLLAQGDDGAGPWLRIERVPLPSLHDRIVASGAFAPNWIEHAVRAAFATLAVFHAAMDADGPLLAVHADVSPANIALTDDASRAILFDLDLAWWRDGPPRDGAFRGTIAYVAPEVARGERPTPRSDLFSLAATLLHATTGATPRVGRSFAALLATAAEVPLLTSDHAALAARGPGHAFLLACLAHEPRDRPARAHDATEATAVME